MTLIDKLEVSILVTQIFAVSMSDLLRFQYRVYRTNLDKTTLNHRFGSSLT